MYEARFERNKVTDEVDALAVSWDGDEYASQGEIYSLTPNEFLDSFLAVVVDGPYTYAAVAQFNPDDGEAYGALLLDLRQVEGLIEHLPAIRDALEAAKK